MSEAEGSLVVFTPSGKRGRFDEGTNLLDAARSLGVDLDSVCGGRGICGRCQVVVSEGEFAKHGITSRGRSPHGVQRTGVALSRAVGARRRSTTRVPRPGVRRPRRGRAAGEPDPPPGGAQGSRRAPDRGRPGRPSALRRGPRTRPRRSQRRSAAPARGARPRLVARGSRVRPPRARHAAADAARRRLDRHGGRARRVDDHGDLARLPRRRVGRGVRHRLHHRGRPPLRPAHRRGARERRRDEPADPVRRGPDEPRELRDDESRRRDRADPRGPRVRGRARRRALHGGRGGPERRARPHDRRQPDHASPVPRPRPDRAGRRTVRAGHRRGGATRGAGAGSHGHERRGPRLRPAVHRGPRRRRHRRRDPVRGAPRPGDREPAGRRRHERRDRAGQPRPHARGVEPDGPGVRGCPDLVRPAGGSGRDRTRPHRPRDPGAAVPRDRPGCVVGRSRLRRRSGHRRVRFGDHRGGRRAVPRRRSSPPTA